mmetsp:Transcript_51129/g.136490  ORF Transcript_51129/g.136490 Transcript_51129/m.136490 type:complete len:280 (+) Transcript_51129:2564-3403(+)
MVRQQNPRWPSHKLNGIHKEKRHSHQQGSGQRPLWNSEWQWSTGASLLLVEIRAHLRLVELTRKTPLHMNALATRAHDASKDLSETPKNEMPVRSGLHQHKDISVMEGDVRGEADTHHLNEAQACHFRITLVVVVQHQAPNTQHEVHKVDNCCDEEPDMVALGLHVDLVGGRRWPLCLRHPRLLRCDSHRLWFLLWALRKVSFPQIVVSLDTLVPQPVNVHARIGTGRTRVKLSPVVDRLTHDVHHCRFGSCHFHLHWSSHSFRVRSRDPSGAPCWNIA